MAAIKQASDEAQKDNDLIYHEKLIDPKQLAPIEKAALSKPLMPSSGQPLTTDFKDLFLSLMSLELKQAAERLQEKKKSALAEELKRSKEATQTLNAY